jgi:hypothetical protein
VLSLLAVGSASASKPAQAITGTWVFEANGISLTMVLNGDGNGTFSDMPLTWTYAGTTLTIVAGGQTEVYQAVLRGDSLELSGGDLPQTATFRRKGGGGGAAPPAEGQPEGAADRGLGDHRQLGLHQWGHDRAPRARR